MYSTPTFLFQHVIFLSNKIKPKYEILSPRAVCLGKRETEVLWRVLWRSWPPEIPQDRWVRFPSEAEAQVMKDPCLAGNGKNQREGGKVLTAAAKIGDFR